MNILVTCNSAEPRPPCVICGTPYEKHGTFPTCASHDYSSGAIPGGFSAEQMRQFWEAGRRAGLEEAAKLCDERLNQGGGRGWNQAMDHMAAAIRAKAKP